jgi:hypothetical protein
MEVNMKEVKALSFVFLGSSVRYLLDVRKNMPITVPASEGELSLLTQVKRLGKLIKEANLPVSLKAFESCFGHILVNLLDCTDEHVLAEDLADQIRRSTKEVANVLKYEAQQLNVYAISDKRISTEKLMTNVEKLFAASVFVTLPDIAQYDFTQSGKCIALEQPTAASFHCLRGTESVLREYYSHLKLPTLKETLMWGPMIIEMRKISVDAPPRELLDNLDNIRVSFRNPTQHPEKRYDIDEAQDLFNLCVDAINRMVKDLFQRGIWKPI